VRTFPETASAFSPEDLYSNVLGVNIAVGIAHRRYANSEDVFNRSADAWIRLVAHHLGAVPKDVATEAMYSIDQHWWDSSRRLPDKELTLRRHLDADETIEPWLIPPDRAPESLREVCGENPKPAVVKFPSSMLDLRFSDWVEVVIEVDDNLAAQEPFTELGRRITDRDFPKIIESIREQNRREFGPGADQPN
jgi:hypothetical protein